MNGEMHTGVFHPPGVPYSLVTLPIDVTIGGFLLFAVLLLVPFLWYLRLMWGKERMPLTERVEEAEGDLPGKEE